LAVFSSFSVSDVDDDGAASVEILKCIQLLFYYLSLVILNVDHFREIVNAPGFIDLLIKLTATKNASFESLILIAKLFEHCPPDLVDTLVNSKLFPTIVHILRKFIPWCSSHFIVTYCSNKVNRNNGGMEIDGIPSKQEYTSRDWYFVCYVLSSIFESRIPKFVDLVLKDGIVMNIIMEIAFIRNEANDETGRARLTLIAALSYNPLLLLKIPRMFNSLLSCLHFTNDVQYNARQRATFLIQKLFFTLHPILELEDESNPLIQYFDKQKPEHPYLDLDDLYNMVPTFLSSHHVIIHGSLDDE
jgi:hypothetical protein